MAQVVVAASALPVAVSPEVDETDDASSVDTNDALLDMLGLSHGDGKADNHPNENRGDAKAPLASILVMDEEEEEAEGEQPNKPPSTTATSVVLSGSTCSSFATTNPLQLTPIARIPLPPKCSRYGHAPDQCAAVVVDDFLSPLDCQTILQLAQEDARGFQYITEASHTAPDGTLYKVPLQNPNPHKLAVLENHQMIQTIWKRLQDTELLLRGGWLDAFQQRTGCGTPRGLNPRLRVLQYDATDNDRFEPHFDATTHVGDKVSRITVLLYLNTGGGVDFDGGETKFLNAHISQYNNNNNANSNNSKEDAYVITPRTGRLVMFEHDLYHSGAPLQWGTKHVLRTDILFDEDTVVDVDEEPTKKEDRKDGDNDKPKLVVDVCQALHWTLQDQTVLEDMGVLHGTLEAFLVPGVGLLTQLLLEGGIDRPRVDQFLQAVQEQVRQQRQRGT